MTVRKVACLFIVCLILGGCNAEHTINGPEVTLPPFTFEESAPTGDLQGLIAREQVFYLPDADGERLSPVTETVSLHPFRWNLEELSDVQISLEAPDMRSLPGWNRLSLSGTTPVEVSNGIATVNLSASALSLTHQQLYTVCQAIANTLCVNLELMGVNILIGNVQPGLDLGGTTPAGTLLPNTEDSLSTLWNRAESRRAAVQENRRFSSTLTVYLPSLNGMGIVSEMREVTFEDPTPEGICLQILDILTQDTALKGASPLPDMRLNLADTPVILEGGGDKVLHIAFSADLPSSLQELSLPLNLFAASLVYTLTTFTPGLTGIAITVGGEALTDIPLRDTDPEGTLTVPDGIFRRAAFSRFLYDEIALYMASGDHLVPVTRAVPWYESRNPRCAFDALVSGSTSGDSVYPLDAPLPGGSSSGDLIGAALTRDNQVLKINLSRHFMALCGEEDDVRQVQILYAVINSLIDTTDVPRVAVFTDSMMDNNLSALEMRGIFLKNEDILSDHD